jgi:hypothetical protein
VIAAPVPRRLQPQDAERDERRGVRPVAPSQNDAPAPKSGEGRRAPRVLDSTTAPAATGIRRSGGMQTAPRSFESQQNNPAAAFSQPTPRRIERDSDVPRYVPAPPAPRRDLPDAADGRNSARFAPSRPEPRIVTPSRDMPNRQDLDSRQDPPSRMERSVAPSRDMPRAAPVSPRSSGGAATVHRPSDDDRDRGNRDR